ncbi:WhiB family transcriptional regulator [Rhodococcus sp. WS4]|nr:WhiB family transcriptional regulator [Rhodococcus sp. WS4]
MPPDTAVRTPAVNNKSAPYADDTSWRNRGACRFYGPTLFFGGDGEPTGNRTRREQRAKTICGACPVLVPCRAFALRAGERFGIWGGTTERERRTIRNAETPRRIAGTQP